MKKNIFVFVFAILTVGLFARDFKGKVIAVPEPTFQFGDENERWIPLFVQGQITTNLQNYSGMTIIDRQNINKAIQEQKLSEIYSTMTETEQVKIGRLVAANYIVAVSIIKKGKSFAIDAKINDAETGTTIGRAYNNPNFSAESLEDGSVINELCYELLRGLGVAENKIAVLKKPSRVEKQKTEVAANKNDAYADAFLAYKKEAEAGNAEAQNNLGRCYEKGEGTSRDYGQAVYWYKKAAEQEDVNAQNNLGVCYYYGRGVSQDYGQAVYWWKKAAERESARAQNNLGYCYANGQGVKQDYLEALYLYQKAAEQGYAAAQTNLGLCYYNGQGVSQDYGQAAYWWKKAAEQGDAGGQYNFGVCYENGQGVQKDIKQAIYWYKEAAAADNDNAKIRLKKLGIRQ